jgi:iron(III) transport system permease protein
VSNNTNTSAKVGGLISGFSCVWRASTALIAITVGILALLPLIYLGMRALETDAEAVSRLLDTQTLTVIGRSLGLMLAVMAGAFLIGLPFAWLTARTDLPFRHVWLVLGLVPMVAPTYLIAVTYILAFGPRGMLQKVLALFWEVERLPSIYGFFGAWLVLTLCTYPYVVLPVRAVLLQRSPLLEEAAADLGANRWTVFWRVILPQCRPALISGMMLAGLYSLSDFGAAAMMRYDNFTRVIYLQYLTSFDRSGGAVLALILVIISLGLLVLERYTVRETLHTTSGTPYLPARLGIGRWRLPALAFCSGLIGLGVAIPFGVLVYWLTNKTVTRSVDYDGFTLITSTLGVSALATILVALIAIPLTVFTQRSPTVLSRWLGHLSYLGYGLPGIVIGLALVFFTTQFLTPLYQTLPILIAAYILRFLPISLSATQSAFTQVNPRLKEAAQALGAKEWQMIGRIMLPLSRAGILGGMVLVFLAVMKELPITLLLAPIGFHTLSYRIWSAYQEAIFSQIGLPGLLLMGTSALAISVILKNDPEF